MDSRMRRNCTEYVLLYASVSECEWFDESNGSHVWTRAGRGPRRRVSFRVYTVVQSIGRIILIELIQTNIQWCELNFDG